MPVIPIDDFEDPRLAVYRDLKYQVAKRQRHWFIVEGLNLTRRLLVSPIPVLSVLTESECVDQLQPLLPAATPLYVAAHALLERLAGYKFHRGVLACGSRPPNPELATLGVHATGPVLLPVCIGVQDPENVGVIVRSSAALGAVGVVLGPECSDPFSRRVARTSMGAVFRLPIHHAADPRSELLQLRGECGFQLVATVLDERAEALPLVVPAARTALLFGNEGFGLDPQWSALCDRRVTIPMQHGVDSLNVSVAAGIFLYHFLTAGAGRPHPTRRDGESDSAA